MKKIFYLLGVLFVVAGSLCAQTHSPESSLKHQQVLGGVQLAYSEAGSGSETILFIHGLGGSHQHWQQNIPALSQNYRTLAVDLPGYGASRLEKVPQDSLLDFFSASLLALLDSLAIDEVHLAGHSMGGQIAMLFALEHPERVGKLVLVAPAGIETFSEAEGQGLRTYAANVYPQKATEAQIRQNYALNFFRMPEAAEVLIQERLALNESSYFPVYANVLVNAVAGMLDTPLASRLQELDLSVLLLFGEEDQLIPNRFLHPDLKTAGLAQKGQQAIPNSKLIMIPEAGHLLMFEQPEAFNRALKNFLDKSNPN